MLQYFIVGFIVFLDFNIKKEFDYMEVDNMINIRVIFKLQKKEEEKI